MENNKFDENDELINKIFPTDDEQMHSDGRQANPTNDGGGIPPEPEKKKTKHHILRNFIIAVLVFLILLVSVLFVLSKQPIRESEGQSNREKDFSTILIAGTDDDGYRTDTIILAAVDSSHKAVSLLSIPRDTYCDGYSVPKINSACGAVGGGKEGMEELMDKVSQLLGFMPDGYVMINLDAFAKVVDIMGGVDFDVPMDMNYTDPTQDLYINLSAGYQHLDGSDAIGLVRFRSGYAMADLTRVSVQRDFMQAAMDQWLKPVKILRYPRLVGAISDNFTTDLSLGNMIWLTYAVFSCDPSGMVTETLPGAPATINGGSYIEPDDAAIAALMEESFSPYA